MSPNPRSAVAWLRKPLLPLLLASLLLAAGCGRTPPIAYYQLTTIDEDQVAMHTVAIGETTIGIGPVHLPERLDRPQMVTLLDDNRVQVSETHRWIEPLAENFRRALRENLSVLLNTERLLLFPWNRSAEVDYRLVIDVIRFEGRGHREADLEAVWSVRGEGGRILLPRQRSVYRVKTAAPDYRGLVSAQSQNLVLFSREIARQLLLLANQSSPEKTLRSEKSSSMRDEKKRSD